MHFWTLRWSCGLSLVPSPFKKVEISYKNKKNCRQRQISKMFCLRLKNLRQKRICPLATHWRMSYVLVNPSGLQTVLRRIKQSLKWHTVQWHPHKWTKWGTCLLLKSTYAVLPECPHGAGMPKPTWSRNAHMKPECPHGAGIPPWSRYRTHTPVIIMRPACIEFTHALGAWLSAYLILYIFTTLPSADRFCFD